MKIIRTKDYDGMCTKAAEIVAAQLHGKPESVLGLATGATALGIYNKLIEMYRGGEVDFSHARTVNLDEYAGLPGTNEQSYRYYMNRNFFSHVNIKQENTHLPDGMAGDLASECAKYNELIGRLGGIDLQILGLGTNGHIGFNEPGDYFAGKTHIIELDGSTIKANARFFGSEGDVPRKAVTMGVGEIMGAGKIILCVSGSKKADILKQVMTGPVMPAVPGSILQFHTNCTVIADEDALGG